MGKSKSTSIRARCPRCGKIHRHFFDQGGFWSGSGMPRYYCSFCLRTKESPYDLGLEGSEKELDIDEYILEQSQYYELVSINSL